MVVARKVGSRVKRGWLSELALPWRNCVRQGLFLRRVAYIIACGNADVCHPLASDLTGVIGLPPSSWEPQWTDAGTSQDTQHQPIWFPYTLHSLEVSDAGLLSQVPRPP